MLFRKPWFPIVLYKIFPEGILGTVVITPGISAAGFSLLPINSSNDAALLTETTHKE
jgi:hypothetical protein